MRTLNYKTALIVIAFVFVLSALSVLWQKPWEVKGSVAVGNQYQSTTTPNVADITNLCPPAAFAVSSSTTGVLGSVNVLLSGAGTLTIYDATTTDSTLRNPAATSSLILADFPVSPTVGSYHFDVEFKRGLLVDYSSSDLVSSTTISYRCEG